MDQSGSRHPFLISPLIERSERQTPRQRTLYAALTLAFWLFWFYLWLPLLALLAWALGLQQAYQYMVVLGGWHEVVRVIAIYAIVILALGGGLVLWATYNIFRFGGVENRTAPLPVTPAEIGRHFGQDAESVARWQDGRRLLVTHDQDGRIAAVDILGDGGAVPV